MSLAGVSGGAGCASLAGVSGGVVSASLAGAKSRKGSECVPSYVMIEPHCSKR